MVSWINIFGLAFMALLFSSCCKCRGDEPYFTNQELLELPSSGRDSLIFVSNTSDTVINKIQKKFNTRSPTCLGWFGSCCECPEDYIKDGSFEQMVNSNSSFYFSFRVLISKDKSGFELNYLALNYPFSQFDSTIQNYSVRGKVYPEVYYKKVDPSNNNNLRDVQKIYFVKDLGLIKYEFVNGEIWEYSP